MKSTITSAVTTYREEVRSGAFPGREQSFKLERLSEEPVFSEFAVANPQTGGRYRVAIRGTGVGENFCSCFDFATNDLGTCKHIEFTLARLEARRGGKVRHLDLTLICERPKIHPHRDAMRARIAEILDLPLDRVSVKATTTEGMGFTGREEGVMAQAVATKRPTRPTRLALARQSLVSLAAVGILMAVARASTATEDAE